MGGRLTMHLTMDSRALAMLRQLIDEVPYARVQRMNPFDRDAFEALKCCAAEALTDQERDAARKQSQQRHADRMKPKCRAEASRVRADGGSMLYVCERPESHEGDCKQGYVMWPKGEGGSPYVIAAGEKLRF